jgi:hypothetical protein
MSEQALLDDPNYQPVHRPSRGRPPEVVAKWGAASQRRWFLRFREELAPCTEKDLAPFYCDSVEHRGLCCASCRSEQDDGYYYTDSCCCRAT